MAPRLVFAAVLLAGCISTAPATTTGAPTTTAPPASTNTSVAATPCTREGSDFVADGPVASLTRPDPDAAQLAAIGWEAFENCVQLVLEFASADGAPSVEPPSIEARLERSIGILRIRLGSEIVNTAVSDQLVETALVDRVYVVRALAGDLFVDLHLTAPAQARLQAETSPGRVIIETIPGGDDFAGAPAIEQLVVVTQPSQPAVVYPLLIEGYSRTFEANVVARIRQNDVVEAQAVTTAAEWTETWGQFALEISDGPSGGIELFVGSDSPADGTEQGVRLKLTAG